MPKFDLQICRPDPDALLRNLSRHIDDGMLAEIATADYGHDIEEHLRPLSSIRDQQTFVIPMRWQPSEVLELIRWSEPDNPKWRPGGQGVRGHFMRAFACAALLRVGGEFEETNAREGWNSTVIQLIGSLAVLGPQFDEAAAQFFSWLIPRFAGDPEAFELAFLGVGLLWFTLHLRPRAPDEAVVALCQWIVDQERRDVESNGGFPGRWLIDSTHHNSRRHAWARLGRRLADLDLADLSPPARDWVGLIAAELSAG